MSIVTGDRYLNSLVTFVENHADQLLDGTLTLKLNPVGLHYVQSRLESLSELERLLCGAPVDYLRAYISDLGDHRALEQLRRILRLLTSIKVVSEVGCRDPTPVCLLPFGRLKVLELRGCDLSTSAARGLLELRHTLEKLICHNSTDALRHIFASRIAEIRDSPQWNQLSFVSCACNGLVLMDESLRLLKVVETLDLSRNKFAKVDNLWRCIKLKHLDLGFNHLRSISSFSKVSCQIVKLVLRNNALSTLHGVENLKSLEGLDLSYNLISNFSVLELLAGLPYLRSLWLEGNPLCTANWYRPQVFSFFPEPDELLLDDKKICSREFWKRQIIIASRHKQPASFGFYTPAKEHTDLEGNINTKRKKLSRLANIECDTQSTAYSEDDSISCDIEARNKQGNGNLDEGAEIVDFMNRIEFMKKKRSILWLEEFKEWMDPASEDHMASETSGVPVTIPSKQSYSRYKTGEKHFGETSRYVADSFQASGDESSINILESDSSFADSASLQFSDRIGRLTPKIFMSHSGKDIPIVGRVDPKQGHLRSNYDRGTKLPEAENSRTDNSINALSTFDAIIESRSSSSACPGSPPHYQEDILLRRHNLEEEFLQLSAESYSIASSDSNTSDSADGFAEVASGIPTKDMIGNLSKSSAEDHSFIRRSEGLFCDEGHDILAKIVRIPPNLCAEQPPCRVEPMSQSLHVVSDNGHRSEGVCVVKEDDNRIQKRKCRRKPKKRVISLESDSNVNFETEPFSQLNGCLNHSRSNVQSRKWEHAVRSDFHMSDDEQDARRKSVGTSNSVRCGMAHTEERYTFRTEKYISNYFNAKHADVGAHETCIQYTVCNCFLKDVSDCIGSEVAVLLSSERKLYILLLDSTREGPGPFPTLVGCHKIEDVKEVLVGFGLQVIRVHIQRGPRYLFITRSIEKSRQLFCVLDFFNSCDTTYKVPLISLEQKQVALFERCVCRGSQMSIFQYSMVLFRHNNVEEELWFCRSLFVLGDHMLVCFEDITQFGSASEDALTPYFSLDSCCSIVDALEAVIELGEICCVTLVLKHVSSDFGHSSVCDNSESEAIANKNSSLCPSIWKIKWFSEESLLKFVSLLKAFHDMRTTTHLNVRYVSK